MDEKIYLEVCDVADRYLISCRHWQRLVQNGKAPPPVNFGRLNRWDLRVLRNWEARGCPDLSLEGSSND